MKIHINGKLKTFEEKDNSIYLSWIIKQIEQNPKLIVVEFNGTILNRQFWDEQKVHDGDQIEIVTIVGGG